jgi:hypothetical protein
MILRTLTRRLLLGALWLVLMTVSFLVLDLCT